MLGMFDPLCDYFWDIPNMLQYGMKVLEMLLCGLKESFDHINSCTDILEITSNTKNKQTPHIIFQKRLLVEQKKLVSNVK